MSDKNFSIYYSNGLRLLKFSVDIPKHLEVGSENLWRFPLDWYFAKQRIYVGINKQNAAELFSLSFAPRTRFIKLFWLLWFVLRWMRNRYCRRATGIRKCDSNDSHIIIVLSSLPAVAQTFSCSDELLWPSQIKFNDRWRCLWCGQDYLLRLFSFCCSPLTKHDRKLRSPHTHVSTEMSPASDTKSSPQSIDFRENKAQRGWNEVLYHSLLVLLDYKPFPWLNWAWNGRMHGDSLCRIYGRSDTCPILLLFNVCLNIISSVT